MDLSIAIIQGQSGPGSDGNKGLLRILQSSSITGGSPSDCLVSYPGNSSGESDPSAEMQSVHSAAPVDLASTSMVNNAKSVYSDLFLLWKLISI